MSAAMRHPQFYQKHRSGVPVEVLAKTLGFALGNALVCLWESEHRGDDDGTKACLAYIRMEMARRESECYREGYSPTLPRVDPEELLSLVKSEDSQEKATLYFLICEQSNAALSLAVRYLINMLNGVDDEDEEDLRR